MVDRELVARLAAAAVLTAMSVAAGEVAAAEGDAAAWKSIEF